MNEGYWSFTVVMSNLPQVLRDHLEPDMAFFVSDLHRRIWEDMNKIKSDKTLIGKIIGAISKFSKKNEANMQMTLTNLETLSLKELELIKYTIQDIDNQTILTVYFHEVYFTTWDLLKSKPSLRVAMMGAKHTTRKGMMEEFAKNINKVYTTNYTIRETIS